MDQKNIWEDPIAFGSNLLAAYDSNGNEIGEIIDPEYSEIIFQGFDDFEFLMSSGKRVVVDKNGNIFE